MILWKGQVIRMMIDRTIETPTRRQWREWLSDNHATEKYVWLISTKEQPEQYVDFVEEALCFGWVDSTRKKTDDGRLAQRYSPRSKKSNWTELNKERVRRMERLGLMTAAGRAALPDMRPEAFVVDEDIAAELRQDEALYRHYLALPELYVRIRIDNIQSVRGDPALFRSRLDKFIENTREGKLYGQWHDDGRLLGLE